MLNLGDLPKKYPNMNVITPVQEHLGCLPNLYNFSEDMLYWWAWPLQNKAQTGRHLAQNELSSSLGTGTQECWFFSLAASEDK